MGKRHQLTCDILETVWSEPGSPTTTSSSSNSMTASVEMNGNETSVHKTSARPGRTVSRTKPRRGQSAGGQLSFFPMDLAEALESLNAVANGDPDQLFLLPDRVLTMDSLTFREDVASIAPCFITQNCNSKMSNSLVHSRDYDHNNESNKLLRVLDDTEGLILTRASNGCLWLCDTTTMVGSSSPNNLALNNGGDHGTVSPVDGSNPGAANLSSTNMSNMSTSSIFDSPGDDSRPSRRQFSNRNRNDPQALAIQKEREERVRRIREQQEEERKRKLEELRQHAISAQKFREQQEMERRRHLEELRYRDEDKRSQVEERRRAIEAVERDRRELLLKKNQEREERIETKRRQQSGQMNFAFGSSTPRIIGTRTDSNADIWGSGAKRSTSSSNVNNQLMTQSLYSRRSSERDQPDFAPAPTPNRTTKRATSAHGLNQSGEDNQKLSVWGRQSTFAGAPSTLVTTHRNNRARSENRTISYGFGSGIDRFSHIQSTPNSPVQERPVSWYVRDIDIGDVDPKSKISDPAQPEPDMFGHRPMRRRSRHECHFQTGCHVPVGEDALMSQSFHAGIATTAHRRRTDLMPTITSSVAPSHAGTRNSSRMDGSRSSTPGNKMLRSANPGLSLSHPRSPSAMSTDAGGTGTPAHGPAAVRLRASAGPRRPRPISIATTGIMSTSMYEKGSKATPGSGSLTPGSRPSALKLSTPDNRKKRHDDDDVSQSSTSSSQQNKTRKTPAQVKAESAARKAKKSPGSGTPPQFPSTPLKSSSKANSTNSLGPSASEQPQLSEPSNETAASKTPSDIIALTGDIAVQNDKREATPDLISVSPVKERSPENFEIENGEEKKDEEKESENEKEEITVQVERSPSREMTPDTNKLESESNKIESENEANPEPEVDHSGSSSNGKKIISSEAEAKARLAEKRREIKEKKEREAEIERQRLLAIQLAEEERQRREEEEERRAQEEADRLAEEARRVEEDRLERAIQEQEKKEKEQKEREEQNRREKEESERRAKEEAEKKRVDLEEKLRKEEEERMARKKRIEEIMARTRGAKSSPTATPQSPVKANDVAPVKNNEPEEVLVVAGSESPKSRSEPVLESSTPDLLGDISVKSDKMAGFIENSTSDIEKGLIDMHISAKNEDARMNHKNSTKSMDLSEFDGLNFRQASPVASNGQNLFETSNNGQNLIDISNNGHDNDVDQILDLSDNLSAIGHRGDDVPVPIIAFEENRITSPKQEVSAADLLS